LGLGLACPNPYQGDLNGRTSEAGAMGTQDPSKMVFHRWLWRGLVASLALLLFLELLVIINLNRISTEQFAKIQNLLEPHKPQINSDTLFRLRREALSRAALYDELIKKNMLLDGMVVNLNAEGEPEGICDSLLFSSLRFYALKRLGFEDSARSAWSGVLGSRSGAQWQRHPRCGKSLSRDMLMGVLVALRADPEHGSSVFRSMLSEIDRQKGFIGDGPFYVSWLSPGVAGLVRMEAERRHVAFEEWPWILKQSFSSIEYDGLFLKEGYQSHLAGLGLWLELEHKQNMEWFNPRSLLGLIGRLTGERGAFDTSFDDRRRQWIAGRLSSLSGANLFFDWLEHKVNGIADINSEIKLLSELLSMPQFPAVRLPMDCDRAADYIWQRRDKEAIPVAQHCGRTYAGVDFLWMAAILGAGETHLTPEDPLQNPSINLSH
jgi:hypothetical protein